MSRPFTLYQVPSQPHARSMPLVTLNLVGLEAIDAGGVELRVEPSEGAEGEWRCIWLQGSISDRLTARHYYGEVEIEARQRPSSDGPWSLTWRWRLLPEEIEAIESARTPAEAPVGLWLHLSGLALIDLGPVPIEADQQFEIPLDQWRRIVERLGYAAPPSQERLLSPSNLASPSWRTSLDVLAKARAHLAAGESYAALQVIYDAFEGIVSQPYRKQNWDPLLTSLQPQKAEGIAFMLSGYCSYISKVSRHRDRSSHEVVPIDAWETEMAVAVGHYLLAYTKRISAE